MDHDVLLANHAVEPDHLADLQSTIVQIVSHELRTPVSVVLGFASLLNDQEMGPLSSEQRNAVSIILKRTKELSRIVEQLSVLMDVKTCSCAGREPVSLRTITAEVLDARRHQASRSGVELEAVIPSDELPSFVGNADHLKLAVDNLVDNAIKFSLVGGCVSVRVFQDRDCVCLAVCDTGIGIEREKLGRVFKPFVQVDSSVTRRYNGLGMGLAVVKEVVEAHAGQIDVQSELGCGSQFTLRFPFAAECQAVQDVVPAGSSSLSGGGTGSMIGGRLLLQGHRSAAGLVA